MDFDTTQILNTYEDEPIKDIVIPKGTSTFSKEQSMEQFKVNALTLKVIEIKGQTFGLFSNEENMPYEDTFEIDGYNQRITTPYFLVQLDENGYGNNPNIKGIRHDENIVPQDIDKRFKFEDTSDSNDTDKISIVCDKDGNITIKNLPHEKDKTEEYETKLLESKLRSLNEKYRYIDSDLCKKYLGINADLLKAYKMGGQTFGIFRSEPNANIYPGDTISLRDTTHFIQQIGEDGKVIKLNLKGIRQGDTKVKQSEYIDRFKINPFSLTEQDLAIYFEIDNNGQLNSNIEPHNDELSSIRLSILEKIISTDEYEKSNITQETIKKSKEVENRELTRTPDNDGIKVDFEYLSNHSLLRSYFVDGIITGEMYEDLNNFIEYIKTAHQIANEGDNYKKTGKGAYKEFTHGQFRPKGRIYNTRLRESKEVFEILEKYDDPYTKRHMESGQSYKKFKFPLEGIDEKYQPYEEITIIENNNNINENLLQKIPINDAYSYNYPDIEGVNQYMYQITNIGKEIVECLKEGNVTENDEFLSLIAQQYQYGAIIRPFQQVNNSLFMNLVNAQLKLGGYKGISHSNLDFIAQRSSPETFAQIFRQKVLESNSQ